MTLEDAAQELNLNLEAALDRVVNKRELLIHLLKVYVNGEYMDNARQALKLKDYKTVEANIHSMKGSGASLGLEAMADACHQVVSAIRAGHYEEVRGLYEKADAMYQLLQKIITQIEE